MTDSKLFRHYVRSKTNTKTGISNLDLGNGFTTTSDQDIARTLNNYFATVFVDEQGEDLPEFKHRNYTTTLNTKKTKEVDVEEAILSLNTSKSCGPDNIHPKLLKGC